MTISNTAQPATNSNPIPKTFAELAARPFEDLLQWAKADGHKFTKPPTRNKLLTLLCAPRKIKIPAGYFETQKAKEIETNPADDLRHADDTDAPTKQPSKTTKAAKETKEPTEPKARTFRGAWTKPDGNKQRPICEMKQGDHFTTKGGGIIYRIDKKETDETGATKLMAITKTGFEQTKAGHRAESYTLETFGIDGIFALSLKAHFGYPAIRLEKAEAEAETEKA